MDRGPSRRRVLAACGTLAVSASVGWAAIEETVGTTDQRDATASDTDGWPMEQRDPGGTGYAPGASGPKDGVRVRWKRRIDTRLGFAYRPTPIVANGIVYGVGTELVGVETTSGDVVFRADRRYTSPPTVVPARAYRSPTLAFATPGGAVGLHARGGRTVADVRIGFQRWQAGSNGAGPALLGGSRSMVPVGADGNVFVAGQKLSAIDASSGRVRWTGEDTTGALSRRPAVHDGTVYVGVFAEGVRGYDIETGQRTDSITPPDPRVTSITAAPDRLVVGASEGLFGVGYDGTTDWRYAPEKLHLESSTVAVADGVAYLGVGGWDRDWFVAVDTTDGTERWRSRTVPEATPQFAPLAVADGVVYVPTEDGGLAGIDAADGHVRWRFAPGGRPGPWSPAALVDETLYVHGNGHLYALVEA